jgi:small-conductance mechanosensitive channel
MEQLFDIEAIKEFAVSLWLWFDETVLSLGTLGQLTLVLILLGLAHALSGRIITSVDEKKDWQTPPGRIWAFAAPILRPIIALFLVVVATIIGRATGQPVYILDIASSLLIAWIVIRFATGLIQNRTIARSMALLAWTVAALDIVGLLEPITEALKNAAVDVGDARISAYGVLWGAASFALLIWLALIISRILDNRLAKVEVITPSARVLIVKVVRIFLITMAFVIALDSTGIDLTALAVFGGALGVGLGFGLQKVVSNFISGLILLLDRSIKPGDVVEIGGTYGSINALAARYTSVITRDGTEYLIPNEDMITQPVINWSHSNTHVRRRIPIYVSYNSNLEEARRIMNEAASGHARVLSVPAPKTHILEFGDSGVKLELRLWISDPQNGVGNMASDILGTIWKEFHEAGIEFPFPQRVVHIAKDSEPLLKASAGKKTKG